MDPSLRWMTPRWLYLRLPKKRVKNYFSAAIL
jgi:hypothetical protein